MSAIELPTALCDGRYYLRKKLGAGAFTEIRSAWDLSSSEVVAIKVLHPGAATQAWFRDRFDREVRVLNELKHPNVVEIFDDHDDDFRYFAMALARGGDLSSWLRRQGAMTHQQALEVSRLVLRGLQHAHQNGVVHRDIKPTNVLVGYDLNEIRLTDFGIARETADAANLTLAGDSLGTVAYMAPEQCEDPRNASPASDIYSVGAMLYLLITGRSPVEIGMMDLDDSILERVPEGVREVLVRAVAYEPAERYAAADEMSDALRKVLVQLVGEDAESRPRITALDDLGASTTVMYSAPDSGDDGEEGDLLDE